MKKKKPTVIRYHPYFDTVMKNGIIYTRDRSILSTAIKEIEKYEKELKKKNFKFKKRKYAGYYHYWIEY